MPVQTTVQMRRDTAANWTSTNPTLASGEWGLETDTRLMKIGNGSTAWNSLAYQLGPMLDEPIATDPNGAYFTGSGLTCYGVISNFASVPGSSAINITGDIDIRVKVALSDWTPSSAQSPIGRLGGGGSRHYWFYVETDGKLTIGWSVDGTSVLSLTSSVTSGITDGATKWIRATLDVDNGAAGKTATFYTSDDGSSWTQLGTAQTTAGTTSIFSGTTQALTVGQRGDNAQLLIGTIYRAQILNGIGGTTVFDANFETVPADSFAFTESSANAATVTLTTTRYSFGLPSIGAGGFGTLTINANRTFYFPIRVLGKAITLKHFAFEVTTAPTSSATARIAIYNSDNQLQPSGTPIINSGAITVSNAAAAIYRLRVTPTTLPAGNYLIAFNITQNATIRFFTSSFYSPILNTLGANSVNALWVSQTLSGDFSSSPLKWNSRDTGTAQGAIRHWVFLGWS